jgi:hypothetical protein
VGEEGEPAGDEVQRLVVAAGAQVALQVEEAHAVAAAQHHASRGGDAAQPLGQ